MFMVKNNDEILKTLEKNLRNCEKKIESFISFARITQQNIKKMKTRIVSLEAENKDLIYKLDTIRRLMHANRK